MVLAGTIQVMWLFVPVVPLLSEPGLCALGVYMKQIRWK